MNLKQRNTAEEREEWGEQKIISIFPILNIECMRACICVNKNYSVTRWILKDQEKQDNQINQEERDMGPQWRGTNFQ